ncbi:hypothetical protein [Kribbella catacumbae]|uniref:hypothetical protein n=1 Tax=Kribbella catacumbae TaxID=460086 RepID=UPI00036DEBF9|nr:hypothetical protein [Kribbella catacumbae]
MITADEFLLRFFGEGNSIWPGMDQNSPVAQTMAPFLQALAYPGECPVILPRRRLISLPSEIYVIGRDTAHAGRIRELLEASVAHHWVAFDGRVAVFDPTDALDKAVLDFRGPGTTFVLKPKSHDAAAATIRALRRLVHALAGRPLRTPTAVRPVGRMLSEFEVALSSGATDASATLLNEIESVGGISHENVAFLRVRRLSRLGREADLLADGSLSALVYTEPPYLIREAVLGAWARTKILPLLAHEGAEAALAAIADGDADIAMLVDDAMRRTTDSDVAAVCAIVAKARGDQGLLASFADGQTLTEPLVARSTSRPHPGSIAGGLARDDLSQRGPVTEPTVTVGPTSWLEWVTALAGGADISLDVETADTWSPAWTVDKQLAHAMDDLADLAENNLLTGTAALLETDDLEHAAPETAAALINRYLLSERFDPADLTALCALLQIFIRSSPSHARYDQLLGDIREYARQWVSISTAVKVLDIADAVACGPHGEQRDSFVSALLGPLNAQKSRLSATLRGLAAAIADELSLGLDWTVADAHGELQAVADSAAHLDPRVLIYSLDPGTLVRAKAAINRHWPKAFVETSSNKVGSPDLRQHARNADVIVLATRRATHAATGFITINASPTALIGYADGSGSASMLRALESTIGEWSP